MPFATGGTTDCLNRADESTDHTAGPQTHLGRESCLNVPGLQTEVERYQLVTCTGPSPSEEAAS